MTCASGSEMYVRSALPLTIEARRSRSVPLGDSPSGRCLRESSMRCTAGHYLARGACASILLRSHNTLCWTDQSIQQTTG